LTDIFNATHRNEIVASAASRRLPVVYSNRSFAAVGGLMSYNIDQPDLFRRSANYVDRIPVPSAGRLPVGLRQIGTTGNIPLH
jgi:putative tryptophan/tyrosine transport system substrate-binding protein